MRTRAPDSRIWERLYDGLIGRWGQWRKPKAVAGPVEVRPAQAVGRVDGGRGSGGGESHQLTVSLHGKRWTLQKWMESRSPET